MSNLKCGEGLDILMFLGSLRTNGTDQPSLDLHRMSIPRGDDTTITSGLEPKPTPIGIAQPTGRPWLGQMSLSLYESLMDVIGSLSILASDNVSNAATCAAEMFEECTI